VFNISTNTVVAIFRVNVCGKVVGPYKDQEVGVEWEMSDVII
jgi:hypothetical protein